MISLVALLLVSALTWSDATSCGIAPKPYVVGGSQATPGSWPWQISLKKEGFGGFLFHTCGGTVISPRWILTAAHCVKDGRTRVYRVVTGEFDLDARDTGEKSYGITEIIVHPRYKNSAGSPYDIALLRLDGDTEAQAACLPKAGANYEGTSDCFISGWGKDENGKMPRKMKQATSSIWRHEDCAAIVGGVTRDSHYCFGDGHVGGCTGDSGGPLVCRRGGEDAWRVVGVTSFGNGDCTTPGRPRVWTRVTEFISWINGVIA